MSSYFCFNIMIVNNAETFKHKITQINLVLDIPLFINKQTLMVDRVVRAMLQMENMTSGGKRRNTPVAHVNTIRNKSKKITTKKQL